MDINFQAVADYVSGSGARRNHSDQDRGRRGGVRGQGRDPDRYQGPPKGQGCAFLKEPEPAGRPLCDFGGPGAGADERGAEGGSAAVR